ncbi:hypothetical protein DMH12_25955 [Streptomyces sp. WAC 04229]|uniref:hypothetical protein n=1 Tax=Streptomyces sp. WAC 04229 TaxID=2203206 RepID=UPI000F73D5F1|nr:hypothetical protein [Streptomyces sp. WAC 04229]RSN48803.1 hypothetical protein DMH12_25955 [Streptomyces sp. WAC 04229]
MIRTVGFFREQASSWGIEREHSIHDLVRATGEADEEAVVQYLVSGADIFSEMGAELDILSTDAFPIAGGASLKTDGTWVWRLDLPHYVATYHVALPEDFLQTIRSRAYVVPQLDDEALFAVLEEVTGMDYRQIHSPNRRACECASRS